MFEIQQKDRKTNRKKEKNHKKNKINNKQRRRITIQNKMKQRKSVINTDLKYAFTRPDYKIFENHFMINLAIFKAKRGDCRSFVGDADWKSPHVFLKKHYSKK